MKYTIWKEIEFLKKGDDEDESSSEHVVEHLHIVSEKEEDSFGEHIANSAGNQDYNREVNFKPVATFEEHELKTIAKEFVKQNQKKIVIETVGLRHKPEQYSKNELYNKQEALNTLMMYGVFSKNVELVEACHDFAKKYMIENGYAQEPKQKSLAQMQNINKSVERAIKEMKEEDNELPEYLMSSNDDWNEENPLNEGDEE